MSRTGKATDRDEPADSANEPELGLALDSEGRATTPNAEPALAGPVDRKLVDNVFSEICSKGASRHTQRSYRIALGYWQAWHSLRFRSLLAMPLGISGIETFVSDHIPRLSVESATLATTLPTEVDTELVRLGVKARTGPPALATANQRLNIMSWAHQKMGLVNPLDTLEIRALLTSARKAAATSGQAQVRKKPGITRDVLLKLLATCDETPHGVRDRALLLFAFSTGGRRRSEVSDALVSRLDRRGDAGFVYTLAASTLHQSGRPDPNAVKPLAGIAAAAMVRWLEVGQIDSGHLFRSIDRFDRLGGKLSDQSINLIVKKRAKLAGLSNEFSAHSLRSGFATEAGRRGVSIGEGMALTGHRSVLAFAGDHRAGASLESPASLLAEADPASS